MEKINILINGVEKEVYGLLYVYNSKYYFIYTEKELDENGYVILYMSQVGKEIINTQNGPIETGNTIGVEINDPEEQQNVQTSISYIVEDKKNNTVNSQIQYVPLNQLSKLKILSQKRFRLLKSIMVDNFKLEFNDNTSTINNIMDDQTMTNNVPQSVSVEPVVEMPTPVVETPTPVVETPTPVVEMPTPVVEMPTEINTVESTNPISDDQPNENVIIDYRSKYFEEQEKNKELQEQINTLTEKINEIKKVIE